MPLETTHSGPQTPLKRAFYWKVLWWREKWPIVGYWGRRLQISLKKNCGVWGWGWGGGLKIKFCCNIVWCIDIYVFEVVEYEFWSKITVKLGGAIGGGVECEILLYNCTIHGYICFQGRRLWILHSKNCGEENVTWRGIEDEIWPSFPPSTSKFDNVQWTASGCMCDRSSALHLRSISYFWKIQKGTILKRVRTTWSWL